jgi:WS/DGAT/MGAT family acyltransferase
MTGLLRVTIRPIREQLSSLDGILWREGADPELLTIVVNLAVLERSPLDTEISDVMENFVQREPRLRRRIRSPALGLPYWEDDPLFSLKSHVHRTNLNGNASEHDLLGLAERIVNNELDLTRSPWSITIVDGLAGGRSALVIKRHHALIDGVGFARLIAAVARSDGQSSSDISAVAAVKVKMGQRSWRSTFRALAVPAQCARNVLLTVRQWMPERERRSSLMLSRSRRRRFAVIARSTRELTKRAKLLGASVNDVFVAAIALGLRDYQVSHGADDRWLRASMPISVRKVSESAMLGNRFALIRMALPVDCADPLDCLRRCQAIICEQRSRIPIGPGTGWGPALLARLPSICAATVFAGVLKGIDLAVTNFVCSEVVRSFAGSRVIRFVSFGGPSGAALGVALCTYATEATLGVSIDEAAVSDPEFLLRCLEQGIDRLFLSTSTRKGAAASRKSTDLRTVATWPGGVPATDAEGRK